jgi:hypothetical protein
MKTPTTHLRPIIPSFDEIGTSTPEYNESFWRLSANDHFEATCFNESSRLILCRAAHSRNYFVYVSGRSRELAGVNEDCAVTLIFHHVVLEPR